MIGWKYFKTSGGFKHLMTIKMEWKLEA